MRAVDRITTPARPSATFLRAAAGAVGAVFVLVGVLGFVPATVTDHDQLAAAGHHTDARLFGLGIAGYRWWRGGVGGDAPM